MDYKEVKMEVLLFLLVAICMVDTCMTIQIKQQVNEIKKDTTVNGEYEKQLKNYRSIVRSNGKIIKMYEQKEDKKNEKMGVKTGLVQPQEQRRQY